MSQPIVQEIVRNIRQIVTSSFPFKFLIDILPTLLYLPKPLSTWKRRGDYWFGKHSKLFEHLMEEVRQNDAKVWTQMNQSLVYIDLMNCTFVKLPQCFAKSLLSKVDNNELTFSEAAWIAGTML